MSIDKRVSPLFKRQNVYRQTRLAAFQAAKRCSVVCDRLIANRSRSGDLDLQRGDAFTSERQPGEGVSRRH